jgi:hypothetical protein
MATRKTKKTTKVTTLKPKALKSSHARNVKGGGWNVKQNVKA